MPNKNIFAISGSLRAGSSNHNILKHISGLLPADVGYNIYDGLATIPPFDPGLDNDTPPQSVVDLRHAITAANAVIICTPEYAFGVPGQLKNALDWLVSSSTLVNKPVVLITASLGGEDAHASLQRILSALSAKVVDTLLIQFIRSKINNEGNITDDKVVIDLKNMTNSVLKAITK
ncbi:NAD(P)H-dependent oxidoreductase [Mucilaginibacter terrigena]|uniref:NAD(P)H-dependent oxidoreductase n=1 Tax=Mucilaginibacter terrigena TaxID=2492395 RepID=A0A4Q5LSF8_9SPHI|nr:NADPH-dependent FMN reductase [Mucilaginibacter terrigena]RYU92444.1 NAD(P)H-dependent oxidoreductase [Mucilaginibacter terrigena]